MSFSIYVFIFINFYQIKAEICTDGDYCPPPQSCCHSNDCCTWQDNHQTNNGIDYPYTGYYKLKIWDMWYFWILIALLLVSCFGGCGYWWRRQLLLYSRTSAFYPSSHQLTSFNYHHHRVTHSSHTNSTETSTGDDETWSNSATSPFRQQISPSSLYRSSLHFSAMQPPPLYSEVTAKPDLYPVIEESSREAAKTPIPVDNDLIISRFISSGVVCAASPSSSTYSTTQSSVFLPPPYSESDVSAPYTSSYPASNISTPGSVLSYSTNSDVIFNSHTNQDCQLPIIPRPCLSPPLATSPTSDQIPSATNHELASPTSSLNLALSQLEQNVSAIIRHSESPCSSMQVPLSDALKSAIEPNRRNSIGSGHMGSYGSLDSDAAWSRSQSLKYGRRGILVKAKSADATDYDDDCSVSANQRTLLIRSID